MATGLGGTYGQRTEMDPNRSVSRDALPQSVAARFQQQKTSAADVEGMSDEEWAPHSHGGVVDRGRVVNVLRAYENYSPQQGS